MASLKCLLVIHSAANLIEHAGVDAVCKFCILTPPQVHNFKRNSVLLTKTSDWLKHFFHKLVSVHSRVSES